ncbi:MAG: rod shape-determining protein MreD [Syntrophomonadaceae bacterium]|nr:rod shape-determining protein MreD [Syntrophomonadaceae bacterium]
MDRYVRIFILILLPWLAIFLQSTVFSTYSIKGTVPDLVLIFVAFFALLNRVREGTVYGFLCGLLEDLVLGRFIGMNALAKGLTAYILGKLQGNVFQENILVGAFCVFLATCINALCIFLMSLVFLPVFHVDMGLVAAIIYQIVYNIALAVPLYLWYYDSSNYGRLRHYGEF